MNIEMILELLVFAAVGAAIVLLIVMPFLLMREKRNRNSSYAVGYTRKATTNLNRLYREIARKEGLKEEQSIGQISEVFAILGIRWREMGEEEAMKEAQAILKKAGKNSQHNRR